MLGPAQTGRPQPGGELPGADQGGAESAKQAAAVMGNALGWDQAVRDREVEHYLARVEAERQSQKMPDDLTADAARLGVPDVRGYAADRGVDLLDVEL